MADNFAAGGITFKSKEVTAGIQAVSQTVVDETGTDAFGQVTAAPAANTLLGRLKAIYDKLVTGITVTGNFYQATQPVSAAALPLPAGAATSAAQATNTAAIEGLKSPHYKTIAAGQPDIGLGAAPAIGDLLTSLTIVPASTSPGAVTIKDGTGAAITVFPGGANSVSTLHPFSVPLGVLATGAGWKVTVGANVSVIAAGRFS